MNCKDFREIADTYLSDELLVETNHGVFQHLENCANCRQELATRREVREKLRVSLKNSPEFQMNPIFAKRLKANLREEAFQQKSWFNWKIFAPVFATLLIVVTLSFALFYRQTQTDFLANLSHQAINRHEDCGLYHLKEWQENTDKVAVEKVSFVKPLQNSDTKILEVHECEFEGKRFTHYVLQRNGKVVSVLKTASENSLTANTNDEDSIICKKEKGLQMSSFKLKEDLVFVISDMSESENLSIARILSDSTKI